MSLLEMLFQGDKKEILSNFSAQSGLSLTDINALANGLIPKVMQAAQGSMSDASSLTNLLSIFSKIDMTKLQDKTNDFMSLENISIGNALLVGLFGSENAVDEIYTELTQEVKIDQDKIKTVVPTLSSLILSTVLGDGQGLSSMMASMLGNQSNLQSSLLDQASGLLKKN